jgi:hypothetical protein
MNVRARLLLLATPFLLSTSLLHGQGTPLVPAPVPAWVMVTPESSTTAVVLPAGTTYRFGDTVNNRWSAPITVDQPTTLSPVCFPGTTFSFDDPDPGTVKELDVLQTAGPQAITVTNLGVTPAVSVSQIVPGSVVIPTSVPMTPGTAYTLTFSNFANVPGAAPNSASVAFVNAPPTLANRGWVGTQLNMTIDGVTFVCTSGPSATDQGVTLNCTVPQTPTS